MSSVSRPLYEQLTADLCTSIENTLRRFAARHDLNYDAEALKRQSGSPIEAAEIMGFGFDTWPYDADENGGEPAFIEPPAKAA